MRESIFVGARRRAPVALKRLYWSSRSHADQLTKSFRLVGPLYSYFRDRVTVQQAEAEIKRSLETRDQRFLDLMREQVYGRPASPYLALLKHAGCEFPDLRTAVNKNGLDRTLEQLAEAGVYVTAGEFKGKSLLKRGNLTLQVSPTDFEMKGAPALSMESGGSTGAPLLAFLTIDHIKIRTSAMGVFLAAHGLLGHSHAVYDAILPSGTASVQYLLAYTRLGITPDRWFERTIPGAARFGTSYDRLTTYLMVALGKLIGPGFPKPEKIDIRDVQNIISWIVERKKEGKKCCIQATSSNVARIAGVAENKNISIDNAVFIAGGEPVTDAKREVVERVGGRIIPRYGVMPAGVIGLGCANPLYTDEIHVNEYMLGVICHPTPLDQAAQMIHPLLFTSLYPSSSHMLLNVASGDYATMARETAGAPLRTSG